MNTTRKIILPLLLIVIVTSFIFLPIHDASADLGDKVLGLLGDTQDEAQLPETGPDSLPGLIGRIIKIALTFVGTIFLIVTLYGGFLWMTAGGSGDRVEKAGKLLRNGVIGVIIIFLSYAITFFVFDVLIAASP